MTSCPWVLHDKPDQAVKDRWSQLQRITKKNAIEGERALRKLLATDIWFLARYGFGYWFLDEDLHSKIMLQFYKDNWDHDTLMLIPRDHGKTVINTLVVTASVLNNREIAQLYASDKAPAAQRWCKALAHNWLNLPLLQKAFGAESRMKEPLFPGKANDAYQWSNEGYFVNRLKAQRRDPTLVGMGVTASPTGMHPEEVYVDDAVGLSTNNESGYQAATEFFMEAKRLTGEKGVIRAIGTFWSDRCPYTPMITGELLGGRGRYKVLRMPCYADMPHRTKLIWPKKARPFDPPGQMSGKTLDILLADEASDPMDFACQMLNDPRQSGSKEIDVSKIVYSNKTLEDLPVADITAVVIDANSNAGLIHTELTSNSLYSGFPYVAFALKKTGTTKHDRINLTLEPYVNHGKFIVPQGVDIGSKSNKGSLLYELDSVRVAKNDDLADALYMGVSYKGLATAAYDHSWSIYIGCDIATTKGTNSDWTALVAYAVDKNNNLYLLKWHRFQENQTSLICQGIYDFCSDIQMMCKGWAKAKYSNKRLRQYSPRNRITRRR